MDSINRFFERDIILSKVIPYSIVCLGFLWSVVSQTGKPFEVSGAILIAYAIGHYKSSLDERGSLFFNRDTYLKEHQADMDLISDQIKRINNAATKYLPISDPKEVSGLKEFPPRLPLHNYSVVLAVSNLVGLMALNVSKTEKVNQENRKLEAKNSKIETDMVIAGTVIWALGSNFFQMWLSHHSLLTFY